MSRRPVVSTMASEHRQACSLVASHQRGNQLIYGDSFRDTKNADKVIHLVDTIPARPKRRLVLCTWRCIAFHADPEGYMHRLPPRLELKR